MSAICHIRGFGEGLPVCCPDLSAVVQDDEGGRD
jgi:hypothetical protein